MAQGSRPDRVGEAIRQELADLIARQVHDPGVGFVTLTRVKVSPDLQLARVFYTMLGDDAARAATAKALERATPFLRRQIGARIRLRRVPEIRFEFDKSVENQDRIEKILIDLEAERAARAAATGTNGNDANDANDGLARRSPKGEGGNDGEEQG
jgi:ribosome-binding factor A